jgi:hypothetical protein
MPACAMAVSETSQAGRQWSNAARESNFNPPSPPAPCDHEYMVPGRGELLADAYVTCWLEALPRMPSGVLYPNPLRAAIFEFDFPAVNSNVETREYARARRPANRPGHRVRL